VQQLRALIRQARKDHTTDQDAISKGLAPRKGRAYREIFQMVREQLEAQQDE
jgi:ribosome-associated protein